MTMREIRLSFQGDWVLHQGGFDGMFKHRSLQFCGYENNQSVIGRRLHTVTSFLNSSSCSLGNFLFVSNMPLFGSLTQGEVH